VCEIYDFDTLYCNDVGNGAKRPHLLLFTEIAYSLSIGPKIVDLEQP